jgi:hypothetical protein
MTINYNAIKPPTRDGVYEWGADHAALAHEGATLTNGTELPARRWTEAALIDFGFERRFAAAYQQTQNMQQALEIVCRELDEAFKAAIQSPEYDWPRDTKRSNGSTAGTTRDNCCDRSP